jgi:RHS repeat-associated protein
MLLTRNASSYTNDANGNTLTGGGRTNSWDGQNRLTQCVFNGNTSNLVYSTDGLRRQSTMNGTTTNYVFDGQSAVRTGGAGVLARTWLHGPRGPEYERSDAASPLWNLYDGLGSVVGTVDVSGSVVSTRKFDVYGAVRTSTGPSGTSHKYVGRLGHSTEEETGLVYMRARYLDPSTGRFASEDKDADGLNWYAYAGNDPVNNVDSSGGKKERIIWEWQGQAWYVLGMFLTGNAVFAAMNGNSPFLRIAATSLAIFGMLAFAMASIGLPGSALSMAQIIIGTLSETVNLIVQMIAEMKGKQYPGAIVAITATFTYAICILGYCGSIGAEMDTSPWFAPKMS